MPDNLETLTLLNVADLLPGDVLLYHFGPQTIEWPAAKLICWFTNSAVSHTSLFLGGNEVAEADPDDVAIHDFSHSMNKSKWVVVRRLPNISPQPVLDVANAYVREGWRYAYGDLLILAGISVIRQRMQESDEKMDKTPMDAMQKAEDFLKWCTEQGRRALTCSAFVAACFNEASPSYRLDLPVGGRVEGQVPPHLVTPEDLLQTPSLVTIGKLQGS